MVNSISNGWRMEDVWLDKALSGCQKRRTLKAETGISGDYAAGAPSATSRHALLLHLFLDAERRTVW